jgi:hypothetical protein
MDQSSEEQQYQRGLYLSVQETTSPHQNQQTPEYPFKRDRVLLLSGSQTKMEIRGLPKFYRPITLFRHLFPVNANGYPI